MGNFPRDNKKRERSFPKSLRERLGQKGSRRGGGEGGGGGGG